MAKEKNKSPLYRFGEGKSLPHQRNSSPLNQEADWRTKVSTFGRETHRALQSIATKSGMLPIKPFISPRDIKLHGKPADYENIYTNPNVLSSAAELITDVALLPKNIYKSYKKKIKQTESGLKGGKHYVKPKSEVTAKDVASGKFHWFQSGENK